MRACSDRQAGWLRVSVSNKSVQSSNKSVQSSRKRAARASTENARFAMTGFETHFDGRYRFFDALGVICQTCDLGLEECVRLGTLEAQRDDLIQILSVKNDHQKRTTAEAANSSMFPSGDAVCVALITSSVAFMMGGLKL